LEKALDPFFTTKPVGTGAGLGLSISREIVAKHGGSFVLDSTLGKGSRVRISLPFESDNVSSAA
jgi:signal transduction histidine kinase